jgi:hypothetical protein
LDIKYGWRPGGVLEKQNLRRLTKELFGYRMRVMNGIDKISECLVMLGYRMEIKKGVKRIDTK